jgi:hypothetical protein
MSFRVYNRTDTQIHVFISKYSASSKSDDWFAIPVGGFEDWSRNGWEVVAVKFHDGDRCGVYTTPRTLTVYGKNDIR